MNNRILIIMTAIFTTIALGVGIGLALERRKKKKNQTAPIGTTGSTGVVPPAPVLPSAPPSTGGGGSTGSGSSSSGVGSGSGSSSGSGTGSPPVSGPSTGGDVSDPVSGLEMNIINDNLVIYDRQVISGQVAYSVMNITYRPEVVIERNFDLIFVNASFEVANTPENPANQYWRMVVPNVSSFLQPNDRIRAYIRRVQEGNTSQHNVAGNMVYLPTPMQGQMEVRSYIWGWLKRNYYGAGGNGKGVRMIFEILDDANNHTYDVRLLGMNGQLINSMIAPKKAVQFDIGSRISGDFILKIRNRTTNVEIEKFVNFGNPPEDELQLSGAVGLGGTSNKLFFYDETQGQPYPTRFFIVDKSNWTISRGLFRPSLRNQAITFSPSVSAPSSADISYYYGTTQYINSVPANIE